jgi:hypothetical protein
MLDFMEDYLRALKYLSDSPITLRWWRYRAGDQAEAVAVRGLAFTKDDYFRDPAALADLDALQANIDLQLKLGFEGAARRQEIRRFQHRHEAASGWWRGTRPDSEPSHGRSKKPPWDR